MVANGVVEHTLGGLLLDPSGVPWNHALFLAGSCEEWGLNSAALTIESDEMDEDDSHPDAAVRGMVYVVCVADLQDIVDNVRRQDQGAEAATLLQALKFYVKNDAFPILA